MTIFRKLLIVLTIVVGALMLFSIVAEAQEVSVTSKAKGMYLGADGARFFDEGPVLHSDLSLSWKSGVFAGIWTSTGANTRRGFDKEIDGILGYESSLGKVSYTVDVEYFAVQGVDVANANLELGVGPAFIRIEAYTPMQKNGPRKGLVTSAGLRYDLGLSKHLVLNLEGLTKYDSGAFGYDSGWLAQGFSGLSLSVNEKTSVVGGIRWSTPLTHMTDGRKSEAVWEVGLSRTLR